MKVSELTGHPENSKIYQDTDLTDLKNSLSIYGQLEPIVITKSKRIISGHRRFAAIKSLEWDECDIRYIETDNEIISLIEHNRHRQKTTQDILNESRILEKELRKTVGRGRSATKNRVGEEKSKRMTMASEIAQKLNVGTTQLKQIQSIARYDESLLTKVDTGELSVSKAYKQIQNKHLKDKKKHGASNKKSKRDNEFQPTFRELLKKHLPRYATVMDVLKETYPYSLEVTKVASSKRTELVTELELLKKLDSYERMMLLKSDELEHQNISPKEFAICRDLIATKDECDDYFSSDKSIENIDVIYPDNQHKIFNTKNWNILRQTIHNMEFNQSPGRNLLGFVGFHSNDDFRLLGLIQIGSDAQSLGARDTHIGWSETQRSFKREHIVNMRTCVPTQPFGNNHLGGKLIAMSALKMVDEWETRYKTKVVCLITSALHGKPNQYDGMTWWKSIGYSAGEMVIKPRKDTWAFWRDWLRTHFREIYDNCSTQSSPTQALVIAVYRLMGIKVSDFKTSHNRPYYLCPLYENYIDFLNGKDTKLISKNIDWGDWWFKKSTTRYKKLDKDNQLASEILFHERIPEDEIEMWLSAAGKN